MSELPDETKAAHQKRRAIQELMRDTSITPVERNKRMQQIMMGNYDNNNGNENTNNAAPPALPGGGDNGGDAGVSTSAVSSCDNGRGESAAAAPTREMPRRGSSAKELIAKFENVQHNHGRMQGPPPKSKRDDATSRPGAYKSSSSSTTAQQDGRASTTMDAYEQRIQAKAKSNSGISGSGASMTSSSPSTAASTTRPGASSITSNDNSDFEERLRRKSSQGSLDNGSTSLNNNRSGGSGSGSSGSGTRPGAVSEGASASQQFEQRILKKSTSNDSLGSSRSKSSSADALLERRIMEKGSLPNMPARGRTGQLKRDDSSQDSSTKEFEERILAKSSMRGNYKRTNSEDSNDASSNKSGERSLNSYYSERLEQRIMEKTRSNNKMSGGGGGGGSNSNNLVDSMSSFEQRILEKTQRGNNGNHPSSSSSRSNNNIRSGGASSDPLQSSQRFEQRLAAKAESFSRNDDSLGSKNLDMASSTSTTGSVGSEEGSFEKRLRTKLSASSSSRLAMGDDVREARLLSSGGGGGGNDNVREGQQVVSS